MAPQRHLNDRDPVSFMVELARAQSTYVEDVTGGIAVFHHDYPRSHAHHRLLLTHSVPWDVAIEDADRVQGGAGLRHRRIEWLRGTPHPVGGPGWDLQHDVVMSLRDELHGSGDSAQVVPFDVLRSAIHADWRSSLPDADEETVDQLTDRAHATAAACDLTWHAVLVGGAPVAWCSLRILLLHGLPAAQVEEVMTLPEHRRRGYGRAVVANAVEHARAAGCDPIWLEADRYGEARQLYVGLGFEVVGVGVTVASWGT